MPGLLSRCATGFCKSLYNYTSFQLKLSKCLSKVVVDNVEDRVELPEKVLVSKKKGHHLCRCRL